MTPSHATVLVVDDDPSCRDYLAAALEALGCGTLRAGNAGEALRALERQVPDLICTDLRMPGVDGLEFMALARDVAPRTPLLVVTGWAGGDDAVEARRRGAAEVLEKPVSMAALAAALERLPPPAEAGPDTHAAPRGLDATLVQKVTQLSLLTQFGSAMGEMAPLETARVTGRCTEPGAAGARAAAGEEAPLVNRSLDFILRALPGDRACVALAEPGAVQHIAARCDRASRCRLESMARLVRDEGAGRLWLGTVHGTSVVAAPFLSRGRPPGFVCVGRRRRGPPFTWADAELLSAFTAQTVMILENASLRRQLERALEETVTSLVVTLEARDKYTEGHSLRVAQYAAWIAEALGLPQAVREQVRTVSLLHDLGKVGVPDAVLSKAGRLTPEEVAAMRQHPVLGYRILDPLGYLAVEALSVRHHHERFDGTGYPDGLAGDAIPLPARIIAVADAFDAMTSARPYRPPLPAQEAMRRLVRAAGTQFDPHMVNAFRTWMERRFPAGRAA